jgi:hypothetical protein
LSYHYPSYTAQPYTGDLPGMVEAGPPDLLYSSGTAPSVASRLWRAHGRQLAGLGGPMHLHQQREPVRYYPNELKLMEELDDTVGTGIFDAEGTHGQVHAGAGIFAAHYAMPGYLARETFFQPSEVVDATTGRRILPVPAGAVAHDDVAKIAYLEKLRLNAYRPDTLPYESDLAVQSITNVWQNPQRITPGGVAGLGAETPPSSPPSSGMGTVVAVAAAALAAGVLAGMLYPKKRGR